MVHLHAFRVRYMCYTVSCVEDMRLQNAVMIVRSCFAFYFI